MIIQTIQSVPMDDKEFFRLIEELQNPERRRSAIRQLRASDQCRRAHPYFIKIALDDSIPEWDRYDAIHGLNDPKSEEAVLALRILLSTLSESNDLFFTTITALGLQGDTMSGEKIVKYAAPEYKLGLRYTVIEALGRMAYFPAILPLQKLLKDPSEVIRKYSISALKHISESIGHNPNKYDLVPDLRSLLDDPEK